MDQTGDRVSVVICTYTEARWHDLAAAVKSVESQTAAPLEIIVVVDHNPALLERVRAELPGVMAAENKERQGLAGGRNTGIALAKGDLIAFLDDDATAAPDWLEHLQRWCADPAVLGAGGMVQPAWEVARPRWFPHEFDWVLGCSYRGLPGASAQVRNPFGGCSCFRREVFDAVGGFRSEMGRVGTRPLGCEETELAIRARQHWPEKTFVYEPQAKIYHKVPAARVRWSYFLSRCYSEGLSKARVAYLLGAHDGLSSERVHTLQALPKGLGSGLMDTLRGDLFGMARGAAIVVGFAYATAGYLKELLSLSLAAHMGSNAVPRTKAP